MRNGLAAIVLSMLLGGGALVDSGRFAQQPGAATGDGQASNAAAQRQAAALLALAPEVIDCHASAGNTCVGTLTIRPTQAAINQTFRLVAVIATADGTPVGLRGASLICETCMGDGITIPAKPTVIAGFTLQLPNDWRDTWRPQIGEGVIGLVPASNTVLFDGAPKRVRVLASTPSGWQTSVLVVSGLLALLVAVTLVVRLWSNAVRLGDRMGAPAWNSAESWAANLTVGASLVGGVIGLAAIGDFTVFMTKPAYSVVNVLCSSLLLLAPLLYGLSRRRSAGGAMEGAVATVLIAGSLVLWAGTGQLLTFSLLILEVWRASALDEAVAATVVVLSVLLIVGLLVHGHVALFDAAMVAKPVPGTDAADTPAAKVRAQRATETSGTAAPEWTLP
jgi:hypothetical protein